MEKTIYVDVLLTVNFCADFAILYLSGKLLHLRLSFAKLLCASGIGALYGVVCEVFVKNIFLKLLSVALVLILMCIIAFRQGTALSVLKTTVFAFLMAVMLSGLFNVFINLLSSMFSMYLSTKTGSNPIVFLCLCVIFCISFTYISRLFARSISKSTVQVQIVINNKKQNLNLLCDSGNMLKDTYSFLPVIVVKQKSVTNLVGENIYNFACSQNNESNLKFRFVPAKTAAGTRIFPAFKPDYICVLKNGKSVSEVLAVVAVDDGNQNTYLDTDGIIPASLIQNVKV